MRILILHNAYAQPGGEDRVVAAESAALRARGHEVHLCLRESSVLSSSPLRGAAETLLSVANPDAQRELADALARVRPELVHIHNLFPRWGLGALRTLARAKLPVVQTLHNFRWLCAPATLLRDGHDCRLCARGDFSNAVRYACMRRSRPISAAYALALASNRRTGLAERTIARFICVSAFVRDVHRAAGFGGDKLVIKGHFLAQSPRAPVPGDGSLIFVGRLSPEKGLHVLLRALGQLPEVTLKVAGEGPERSTLERAFAPVMPRVRFLGQLPHERLIEELCASSVCVVPSLGSETFGLAALEALACARPVVVSDAGGLPELVRQGETGFIVPRGDAEALAERLRFLLDHPEIARALGDAGRAEVERAHLAGPNLERLETLYDEAMTHQRTAVRQAQPWLAAR